MGLIEKYIRSHSNGRDSPVCSNELSAAFQVPQSMIRRMINKERSNGSPICSCSRGYYVVTDDAEIKHTINSMRSRMKKMESAIKGLESCLIH